MPTEKTETEPDDVLKILKGLAEDAKAAFEAFKKKLATGAMSDPAALAIEVGELFSIQADATQYAFQAHFEHFDWASDVDTDLDELKDAIGGDGTTILPEDATRLKATILALVQNLRPAAGDEDVIQALKKQADEAIAFIDESTAEDDEEEDETEGDDETE